MVGLTGGLGCGKTTVAHLFEELGAAMVNADQLAHEALMEDSPVYADLKADFKDALAKDGRTFDKRKLAGVIFKSEERRKQLEKKVHPYVFERLAEEIEMAEERVVILDIPLLFETGYDKFCDKIIVVSAEDKIAAKRLREKGFSAEDIEARKKAQMPLIEKVKKAHWVINNSETIEATKRQAAKVWTGLRSVLKGEK